MNIKNLYFIVLINIFYSCIASENNKQIEKTFNQQGLSLNKIQIEASRGDFSNFLPALHQNIISSENIDVLDQNEATFLYWAVFYNNLDYVQIILALGGFNGIMSKQYTNGTRPLDIAIKNKNLEIVKELVGVTYIIDKASFTNFIDPNSKEYDRSLVSNINNSSVEIKNFFSNLLELFGCELESKKASVTISRSSIYGSSANYEYSRESNKSLKIQIEIDDIETFESSIKAHYLVVYAQNTPSYYVELFDAAGTFIGSTNLAETNTANELNFYTENFVHIFRCAVPNLDEIVEAITKGKPAPVVTIEKAQILFQATPHPYFTSINEITNKPNPINILGTSTLCNIILVSILNGNCLVDSYFDNVIVNRNKCSLDTIILSNEEESYMGIDFINTFFIHYLQNVTSLVYNTKIQINSYGSSADFPSIVYFSSAPTSFDLKTENGMPITLLGSTTPFDELQYGSIQGQNLFIKLLKGKPVSVDNFDENNIIVTNQKGKSVSLPDFIDSGNFKGTFFIDAAKPLFDIFTKDNKPLTPPLNNDSFDEVKYFTLNESSVLQFFNKKNPVFFSNFDSNAFSVVNKKTNSTMSLYDFINSEDFSGDYYLTTIPPLFDIKSINGEPINPLGSNSPLNQIKAFKNNDGKIVIDCYLKSKAIDDISLNTDFIVITNSTGASQSLTQFLKQDFFTDTYIMTAAPISFSFITKDKKPIIDPTSKLSINRVAGIIDQTATVYGYNDDSLASSTPLDPHSIVVLNKNGTAETLDVIIKNNTYTQPHYLTSSSVLCSLKTKNNVTIMVLGTKTPFNEIQCVQQGSKVLPYTLINESPITIENFDTNNVLVSDKKGNTQTLTEFIKAGIFDGNYSISAAPPLFDIKTKNDVLMLTPGSKTPFNRIKYFTLDGKTSIHTFVNESEITIDDFDANNVMIIDQKGSTQTLSNFIKAGNFVGNYTIAPLQPIFDIKTKNSELIILLGSSTPFNQIKYFMINGSASLYTFVNESTVEVDNFDSDNVLITDQNGINQTLTQFIKTGKFTGNYYMSAAPALLDIKTKNSVFMNIPGFASPLNEVKYYLLKGMPTITPYVNGSPIKIENFNPEALHVKNEKTNEVIPLAKLISSNDFKGDFHLIKE